jgi:hypothetical protein
MNNLDYQIRITPAHEKAFFSGSSYTKREEEGKMGRLLYGMVRLFTLAALIYVVLSTGTL